MPLIREERVMQRCFDLARRGIGKVSPNPPVGAVLEYKGRIIGEGFHEKFGGPHAEVNTLASVATKDKEYISESTLYVSLEPCCIFGKTPPCTNLILEYGIRRVVVSCLDPSPAVNGRGVSILREAGVEVVTGILEETGKELIAPRRTFACLNRPYILLKWAETANGKMAASDNSRLWISNPWSRRLVHRWRMESDAILVGARTALSDNPRLDNRYYYGKSPVRIVLDPKLSLPENLHIFDESVPTIRVHHQMAGRSGIETRAWSALAADSLTALMESLHRLPVGILLVEGGPHTLEKFLETDYWDEARVITAQDSFIPDGKPAPSLPVRHTREGYLGRDRIRWYFNPR